MWGCRATKRKKKECACHVNNSINFDPRLASIFLVTRFQLYKQLPFHGQVPTLHCIEVSVKLLQGTTASLSSLENFDEIMQLFSSFQKTLHVSYLSVPHKIMSL